MIEPTFNELTFLPLCKTDEEVELRLNNFVSLLAKLKEYGINRVRIEETFSQMPLKDGLSLYDVFSQDIKSPDSARRNRGLLLAGTLRQPAVTEDIEPEFYGDEDLDRCVCTSVEPEQDCIGLYVADILKSFSVGFAQSWLDTNQKKMCEIRILHKDESKNKNSAVLCMTTADDENHEMFIELMSSQDDLPVEQNNDSPEGKVNRFPQHHGRDECLEFANQIAKSKYVSKVLNTIDHKAGQKDFIHKFHDDGLIEIRMTWTGRGLGIVVATTGKNKAQIIWIAKHLEKYYKK